MQAAPATPVSMEREPDNRNAPRAAIASRQKETRGAKNRSSSQPVKRRPAKAAPPIAEAANAAFAGEIPRSVSSAESCATDPFWAMEQRNNTVAIIQKSREPRPSPTDAPV